MLKCISLRNARMELKGSFMCIDKNQRMKFSENTKLDKIEIKSIEIENFEELDYFYNLRRPETSDSNLLALYMWKDCYPSWYYKYKNGLIWISENEDHTHYSCIPCCKEEDLKECFQETERFFNDVLDEKLSMYVVDKQAIDVLELPEDKYVVERDRDYDDYIYDAQKLMSLSGKKYHKKKNHLNAFKKEYEGRYEFRLLDCADRQEILDFLNQWIAEKGDMEEKEYVEYEAMGISEILNHCDVLKFKVGGVYIDGILQAFTIGCYYEKEDMVYIPVEKANPEIRGLYSFINNEFLKQAYPNVTKVNREDDMGLEGLRQAKMSYNPIYMVEKYTIKQK